MRLSLRPGLGQGRSVAALSLAALLAACSSGSSGPAGPTTAAPSGAAPSAAAPAPSAGSTPAPATPLSSMTAAPTLTAAAPAAFQLTASGDANVTGTWGKSFGIDCDNPTFDGEDILFFAQSPDGQAVVLVTLKQGAILVSERHGAGAAYTDREFQGSGVTAFDAAKGASFDTDLTVVPGTGQKPGTLGAITHLAGSVDCGSQGPGTSTVVASGATPEGAVSGAFVRSRVSCSTSAQYGESVTITAIVDAASTLTLMIINLPANGKATVFSMTQVPASQHAYKIAPTGVQTISGTGAHLDADFVEVLAAGATGPAHTFHLAGDVTCGTNTTS